MTALDVARDALRWAEGGDAERGAAALADLEALVEAAKQTAHEHRRFLLRFGGGQCPCESCVSLERVLNPLARVLGTEQDTA